VEQSATNGLEQEIYRLISDAFIQLDTCDQQLMRRFGLTVTQSWALVHLGDPEGRSLSELARLLICDKSNVTLVSYSRPRGNTCAMLLYQHVNI
jgi:hypothetical protein